MDNAYTEPLLLLHKNHMFWIIGTHVEIGQAIMWRQGLPIILDMYVEILINITYPLANTEQPTDISAWNNAV
jgi:hypothetical protein